MMETPSSSGASSRLNLCPASTSITQTITESEDQVDGNREAPVLKLRLHKPKSDKKVKWTESTVDNENMNKKKSKCCCVYVKPHEFGESSSESEDECENCYGHVEMKHRNKEPDKDPPEHSHDDPGNSNDDGEPKNTC